MAVCYTARMQFGPHQDSEGIMAEILGACRAGRIDEVMFFAFAEEQNDGHDPLERIRAWMAAIRPWKAALEAEGVEVSLNPWHSLLHCDRHRTLKPGQDWQTMVDWRGQAASAMACPLDPAWRAYYAEAMGLFAAEGFRVIWVDDDIRYHNHAPLDWGGCWCPLHVAAFNARAGVEASRDEIVAKVLAPGEPHPWRQVWLDLWDESHCALVAAWRDIVEAEGARLGLMSSGLDAHAMEGRRWGKWWAALASRFPKTHRPHFWGYSDGSGDMIVYGIAQLQQTRLVQPDDCESSPEIENFPYGPWNKSFRQTAAQMALAQVFGSDRLAVSLYDFMGNLPSDEPERAAFLGKIKPLLAWLGGQFPRNMMPAGVGLPWHEDVSRNLHTDGRRDWRALEAPSRGWGNWLGAFGFAFQAHAHPAVNALSGAMAWGFDEETLRTWLARGLLLDGPAAAILVERGLGELIGLDTARFVDQTSVLYAMEETVDAEFGLRVGAQMSLNAEKPYKDRLLQGGLMAGTTRISVLRDPLQREVGHGGVLFENGLGGRTAVMPWDASAGTNLCTQRQAQLDRVLHWLSRGTAFGAVRGGAWLVPQFFTDGTNWRGVVWNASPDAIRDFSVAPPEGMGPIVRATRCDAEGRSSEATVSQDGISLDAPLHQWEFVVLNARD
jgi:hypothetical protein